MTFYYPSYLTEVEKFSQKISGASASYYFLYGDADFLIERTLASCINLWKNQEKDVGLQLIYADDLTVEHLKNICVQRQFFSPPTLYVARRIEKWAKLAEFFKNHAPETPQSRIIFCLQKTKKLSATLLKALNNKTFASFFLGEPKPWEIEKSLPAIAKDAHIDLSKKALEVLFEYCGGEFVTLDNSLRTLKLAYPEKKQFNEEEVYTALGLTKNKNVFALSEFLLVNKSSHAELLCERLLESGDSPLGILALIVKHCRTALAVMDSLNSRPLTKTENAIPDFIKRKYLPYVRRLSQKQIEKALILCHEIEILFKSTSRAPLPLIMSVLKLL